MNWQSMRLIASGEHCGEGDASHWEASPPPRCSSQTIVHTLHDAFVHLHRQFNPVGSCQGADLPKGGSVSRSRFRLQNPVFYSDLGIFHV